MILSSDFEGPDCWTCCGITFVSDSYHQFAVAHLEYNKREDPALAVIDVQSLRREHSFTKRIEAEDVTKGMKSTFRPLWT